ncbi:Protein arginine N-methyltransferase 6 [Trichinella patagoniensis]|uniref:Protein arginine N-methyltransferase 6 n=1 Tax=Trichinella patagoniensis TaxID=990121 RepID=A0A0V0ZKC1_9BILA|nr:Protein arginine N-methyltransferase 6 [Trichinella patagoniensis]
MKIVGNVCNSRNHPFSKIKCFLYNLAMTSKATRKRRRTCTDDDESYFESYSDPQCHLHMILDTRRTKAYQEALQRNSSFISGKVVLDVGAGTGILSVFACQAGAKLVHAVEASDIVKHMRRIISDNNMVDKVQVHNVPVEKLQLQGSVDCIVSEWMGYGLMTEWMLPSVIAARNRWLHKDGLMFPERVHMFIIPVGQTQAESWYDVMKLYGVDMDRMVHQEYENMIGKLKFKRSKYTPLSELVIIVLCNYTLGNLRLLDLDEFK